MVERDTSKFPSYDELYQYYIELGATEKLADYHAELLPLLDPKVKERFLHWWKTGELLDDLEVKGYKVSTFMKRLSVKLPTAFIDFNQFLKDPNDEWILRTLKWGFSAIRNK